MKRVFTTVLLGVSFITIGCTPVNTMSNQEEKNQKEISRPSKMTEKTPVTPTIDKEYDFTYLEELPLDKMEKYKLFLEDGNTNYLTDFTPEQIVLIYMNLVLEHNIDRLYALTYDSGQLPSIDIFKDEYGQYLSAYLTDEYLKYRFYDSIAVDEVTSSEELAVVVIKIIFGSTSYSKTNALKKEKNVWKMDLYHLVEESKNGNL